MKRLLVLFILSVHLFNAGGYILLQQYQQHRVDQKMNRLISQNLYDPNALIEVKIAQHIPGVTTNWSDYKNINGQLQLKNACYNYVKMKVTRDTLYVMVIKNYEKTRLTEKNIIYAKQITDIPQGDKGHDAMKKAGSELKYATAPLQFRFSGFATLLPLSVHTLLSRPNNPYLPVDGRPPAILV